MKEQRIKRRYFQLRQLMSLNRMLDARPSHNDSLHREVAKLERKFPGLADSWVRV